jgi:uncharacterized SAM-binding protein YcdF (DUF218 family)
MQAIIDLLRHLASPLGCFWVLLGVSAAILFKKDQKKLAAYHLTLMAMIWLTTATTLPARWLATLERPYAVDRATVEPADAIVVLGGTLIFSEYDTHQFSVGGAFDRVLTGLELINSGKSNLLIVGGGGYPLPTGEMFSESIAIKDWIQGRQTNDATIEALPICESTRGEAVATEQILKPRNIQKILLVSSASHLKRAVGLFEEQGFQVVSAIGCDFEGITREHLPIFAFTPRHDRLDILTILFHELVGRAYYSLRGWT